MLYYATLSVVGALGDVRTREKVTRRATTVLNRAGAIYASLSEAQFKPWGAATLQASVARKPNDVAIIWNVCILAYDSLTHKAPHLRECVCCRPPLHRDSCVQEGGCVAFGTANQLLSSMSLADRQETPNAQGAPLVSRPLYLKVTCCILSQ